MSDTVTSYAIVAANEDPFELAALITTKVATVSMAAAKHHLFGRPAQGQHLAEMAKRGIEAIRSGDAARMGRVLELLNHVEIDK